MMSETRRFEASLEVALTVAAFGLLVWTGGWWARLAATMAAVMFTLSIVGWVFFAWSFSARRAARRLEEINRGRTSR